MPGLIPVLLILLGLAVVGAVDVVIDLWNLTRGYELTIDFERRFGSCAQHGKPEDYLWLTQYETAMATELRGADRVQFIAPMVGNSIQNLPLLSDTMVKLRTGQADPDSLQTMNHILLRHAGGLKESHRRLLFQLINPFRLVIRGLQIVLGLPILILVWSGVLGPSTARRAQTSAGYRFVQAVVTLSLFVADVVSSVIGWPAFMHQLHEWFNI
jgi:hypothetical protein